MYRTDYAEWVKHIETEYNNRQNSKRTRKNQPPEELVGGLQVWFNQVAERIPAINDDLSRMETLEYDGKSKILELDLIATAIAQAFYREYYNEEKDIVIKKVDNTPTMFFGMEKYGKFLLNNWSGLKVMPFIIPDAESHDEENPYYWMEICSALQLRYGVFENVDDLNEFIFTVGRNQNTSSLLDYGLYIRDVQHLCLAFSLMHGYSAEEYRELYRQARKIAVAGNPGETATVGVVRVRFNDFLAYGSKTNEDLLAVIRKYSELLLHNSSVSHKSIINKCLSVIIENDLSGEENDSENIMTSTALSLWFKTNNSIVERLYAIAQGYVRQVELSGEPSNSNLYEYLISRINAKNIKDFIDNYSSTIMEEIDEINGIAMGIVEESECDGEYLAKNKRGNESCENWIRKKKKKIQEEAKSKLNEYDKSGWKKLEGSLRCMLITSNLNSKKAADRSYNNAAEVIDDINDQLSDCGLRPIDYRYVVDRSIGEILNITRDMFDWAVVESLKFDQAVYEQKINDGCPDDGFIWGETLMKYLRGASIAVETGA